MRAAPLTPLTPSPAPNTGQEGGAAPSWQGFRLAEAHMEGERGTGPWGQSLFSTSSTLKEVGKAAFKQQQKKPTNQQNPPKPKNQTNSQRFSCISHFICTPGHVMEMISILLQPNPPQSYISKGLGDLLRNFLLPPSIRPAALCCCDFHAGMWNAPDGAGKCSQSREKMDQQGLGQRKLRWVCTVAVHRSCVLR